MTQILIRDGVADDFDSILRLNDAEVEKTSPMDMEKLGLLARMSCYLKVSTIEDQVVAFLLVMREGAPYQNDNYNWFSSRFRQFVYVDRIVVDSGFAGSGIGSLLYEDLFGYARSQGIGRIVCEYNIEPPNPVSRAFHAKFGFREIGTQWVGNHNKRVSMQALEIK